MDGFWPVIAIIGGRLIICELIKIFLKKRVDK